MPDRQDVAWTAAVEATVSDALEGLPSSLAGPCRRLVRAGGKRLRASLVLASAGQRPGAADAAAAVELLHLATLVHDDMIDDTPMRRGVPTIHAKEGAGTALLAGDLLIGLAGRLASRTGGPVRGLLDEALVDLCVGQALETDNRYRTDADVTTVLRTATLKTGTLLGVACEIGGHLADRDDTTRLRAYGLDFGTMLQLLDDLLDLLTDEATYGKPTGVDFPAGTVTLPARYALDVDADLGDLLRPHLDPADRRRANDLLRAGPGITATVHAANTYAHRARDGVAGTELADLPGRYLDRQLSLVLPHYRHLLP